MSSLIRWDPFRNLSRWPSVWEDEDWNVVSAADQLDVYETESEVVVTATVAGVPDKNVDVTFDKGMLTISARADEEEAEGKKYYRKASRVYSYRVAVPGAVDPKAEPKAEIDNGVITVRFAKAEEAKPKKISITSKASK